MTETNTQVSIDLNTIREHGIFVMAPTYGGMCYTSFAKSMMELSALCVRFNIPFDSYFIHNESLVQRARNYCADVFLNAKFNVKYDDGRVEERHFQHGIFIDSDIEFRAEDVLVLAQLQNENKAYDVICATYPKKHISWEKVVGAVDKGFAEKDPNILENIIGDFVFNPIADRMRINEVTEVAESGTGFMMFRRDTLVKYAETFPNQSYKPDHIRSEAFNGDREITAFFDCVIDPESKRYLSEDYYFCQQVRKAGMHVWLVPWINLNHNGYYTFKGNLGAVSNAGQHALVDEKHLKKKKKPK